MSFFEKKTVITSTGKFSSSKLSKSIDALMDKGTEMLDAGMKVMDEAFKETDEAVSTTIRIRLSAQQISDLRAGRTLTFKTDGTTIRLEGGEK